MMKPVMQKRIYRMISLVMAFLMSVVLLFSVPVLPASALSYTNWPSVFKVNHTLAPTVGGVLSDSVNVSAISALDMQKGKIYTLTLSLSAMKTPSLGTYYNAYVDSAILYINGVASYGVKNGDNFTFTIKGTATGNVSAVPYIRATCRFSPLTPGAVSTNDNFYFYIKVVSQSMTDDPDYTPPVIPPTVAGWNTAYKSSVPVSVPGSSQSGAVFSITFNAFSFPRLEYGEGYRMQFYIDVQGFPSGVSGWITDVSLEYGGHSFPVPYDNNNRTYIALVMQDGTLPVYSVASIKATMHLASTGSSPSVFTPSATLHVSYENVERYSTSSGQVVTDPGVQDAIKDQTAAIEKGTQDQIDNANKNHDDLTNGYDNSGMDGSNSQLSGSLGGMGDIEDAAMGDSKDTIKNFDFGSMMDFSAGVTSGLSFITSVVNSFISASGQFQIVILFSFLMAFLSIIVGLWRYFRGS